MAAKAKNHILMIQRMTLMVVYQIMVVQYDWCGTAIDALEELYHSIKAEVLKGDYLNIDETTVSVIDEDARHVKKEYMWGLVDTRNKLTFFAYEEGSRSRKVISSIL